MNTVDRKDRIRGCLLAGAVGDALGWPVEFARLDDILDWTGGGLVEGYLPAGEGEITDDTQMSLFCAEGLMRARSARAGAGGTREFVHQAFLRWLDTQGETPDGGFPDGVLAGSALLDEPLLRHRRAPGSTCLGALCTGQAGTIAEPVIESMGCGGVMRAAPAGIVYPDDAFEVGCIQAAVTHGHPNGYVPAGALALMVEELLAGVPLQVAARTALARTRRLPKGSGTAQLLEEAIELAGRGEPTPQDLEALGGGWTGHEALAIAVAAALGSLTPQRALSVAVTHSGDADSTGAICGNLVGAAHGTGWIPHTWSAHLREWDIVDSVASQLAERARQPGPQAARWSHR
jgi:ADP-ribosylglycohydrolase